MSYLVLARKFRPSTFDEVIGQDHISQTLKNAISENKVAHAYLFSGPRGTGKTTMARIFAKALNCKEGPTDQPCGKCQNCIEISKNQSMDVFEIDAASNTGVDNIRELRENTKFGATNSRYKIYIIDEVHQLSTGAFNALLKTLEEPPEHVIFILATTEQHKVPITILSRCQKYRFRLLSSKEIEKAINSIAQKEKFEIDNEALNIIINSSGGSMRDALSLLDQALSSSSGKITGLYMRNLIGLLPKEIIAKTTQDLAENNIYSLLQTCKEVYEQGFNMIQFARDLRDHLRQLMIFLINPEVAEISNEDKKLYEKQKSLFTVSQFIRMTNLISKALEEMKWHDQPRILLEMYLLKMAEPYYNIKELIQKIDELGKNIPQTSFTSQNIINTKQTSNIETSANKEEQQFEEEVITMADSAGYDLISLWNEAVTEIVNKHPMTAQPLKTKNVKEINNNTIQVSLDDEVSHGMVKDYGEVLQKLMSRKAGREIFVKMTVEKNKNINSIQKEDIVIKDNTEEKKEMFVIEEDLKETAKTAVPKAISSIAKKFGARSIKKQNTQQNSTITLKKDNNENENSEGE